MMSEGMSGKKIYSAIYHSGNIDGIAGRTVAHREVARERVRVPAHAVVRGDLEDRGEGQEEGV